MRTNAFCTAAAVLLLAACQTTMGPPSKAAETSCDGSNAKPCRVTVTSLDNTTTPRSGTVDFDGLKLDAGKPNLHVFWILKQGCFFNAASGDGVFFKHPSDDDGQFSDQGPTDEESSNPTPNLKNGKKYHWKAKNNSNSGHKYDYKLIFHCDDGAPYVIDPWIQNG